MKILDNRKNLARYLLMVVSGILPVDQVVAQEGKREQTDLRVLEEFSVTATKRERIAQEVPIALTPYSEKQLEYSGVTDIRDLMAVSPSLFLSTSQAESTGAVASIRGVGTTGDNPGFESAVGVFIDGVYRNRNNVALTELGEVERIEVLRGPQGTLFGRNTLMGLINVITKAPSFEQSIYSKMSFSSYNSRRLEVSIGGGLIDDSLAGRVDAVFTKRDGFLKDIASGKDYNNRDRVLIRGQLLLKPGEFSKVRLIADYSDRNEQCCAAVTLVPGPTVGLIQAMGGDLLGDPFDRKASVNSDRGYNENVVEWGLSSEITVNTNIASITSLTAFRDWEALRGQDIDYLNLDIGFRDKDSYFQGFRTFTQELRAETETESANLLVGLFYINEELNYRDALRFGAAYEGYANGVVSGNPFSGFFSGLTGLPPGQVFPEGDGIVEDRFMQKAKSWALFTHNTFDLADNIEVTFGVRYTEETKNLEAILKSQNRACSLPFLANLTGAVIAGLVPPQAVTNITALACLPVFNPFVDGNYTDSRKERKWSSTLTVAYDLSDDDMLFAGYSRGFKAGGYNLDRATLANPLQGAIPSASDLEFDEEVVDSFELGGKFGLLDQRATFNATLFYVDLQDFQLVTFTGTGFLVENLEEVVAKGVELETTALLSNTLTVRGGMTYADTRYGTDVSNETLAGQQLANAPKWTFTGAATYERNMSDSWQAFAHLDLRYMSSYNTGSDLDVEKIQESFMVFNGRIGLAQLKGGFRIDLWAKNLFDQDYIQVAFDAPLQGSGTGPGSTQTFGAFLGNPRTVGVTLRKEF